MPSLLETSISSQQQNAVGCSRKITFVIPKFGDLFESDCFRLVTHASYVFRTFKQKVSEFLMFCNHLQHIKCTNSTLTQNSLTIRLSARFPTRRKKLLDTLELEITPTGGRLQLQLHRISNYVSQTKKTIDCTKTFEIFSLRPLRETLERVDHNWLNNSQFQFSANRIY